jgi:hypothetical protein
VVVALLQQGTWVISMKHMGSVWMSIGLIVVGATSCSFPQLAQLSDAGASDGTPGDDTGGDDAGGNDAGDGGVVDGGMLPVTLEVLAGDIGGSGNADGTGAAARFANPSGVAIDSGGNIYVADSTNSTIRKVTAAGVATTLAGTARLTGGVDGTGAAARFNLASGVAVDGAGNIYVADRFNHTIRKVTATGVTTTVAGTVGVAGSTDGTGTAARFNFPFGLAVDSAGNIYVADSNNHTIRKINTAGAVTTLAGAAGMFGSRDGTGTVARFNTPTGVAVDSVGTVYVADAGNHTIREVTTAGVTTTLAGVAGVPGGGDGTGTEARFDSPNGVAVDGAGTVYVADAGNHTIRKVTSAGVTTTVVGTAGMAGSTDATGAGARFDNPAAVAVDSAGTIYVADFFNHAIRKVNTAREARTLAGAASVAGGADGVGVLARFNSPLGVAAGGDGSVYVADRSNDTIRKVTSNGAVTTLAGTASMSGAADGTGAAARFNLPVGVAVDSSGNVYVGDRANHTIRKVTSAGVVTTLAGTAGMLGSSDGTGAAARFNLPSGMATDSVGNIYVADQGNHTIRKVSGAGVVTILAGTPGLSGSADGTGAAARFNLPSGVAVDNGGTIYVADQANHTIRKLTSTGVVTTLAGTAGMTGSTDGTGAAARFNAPMSVTVDSAGNIYVADTTNSTIRRVTPAGATTTIAGMAGSKGILPGPTARFASPSGLVIFGDSVFVSDANGILALRHGAQ